MAWRRCASCLLFGAGCYFDLGDYRAAVNATDHTALFKRKHGGDCIHNQFNAPVVRQHTAAAGCVETANVETSGARCPRVVLWHVFNNVVMEYCSEIGR